MSEIDARLRDLRTEFRREQEALKETGKRPPESGR
jgi:hypothetical protein